jgi:shikimate kinase/3-dehydroquinate synthase
MPICDTCGKSVDRVRRDVLDSSYDALQKVPFWNCDDCYGQKRRQRLARETAALLEGRQLFVTGFMATGKSKVGTVLADILGRPFVDTDARIVRAAGRPIGEIFEQDGEEAFRTLESQAVVAAATGEAAVIALGGGAMRQDENWDVIGSNGICLCITASPELLSERIGRNEDRPLLAGLDDDERLQRIRELLAEREPFYRRSDAFIESTDDRTPEETAVSALQVILKALRA